MIRYAFKEWAVICAALAQGKQAILIRKGGIAESGKGLFTPDHTRFWLFPTQFHQEANSLKPEAATLWNGTTSLPTDRVTLTHYAEVRGVFHVNQLVGALLLDHLHLWSEETVRKRFEYRTPGLYILPVRIYRVEHPQEIEVTPEMEGCKTWVDLTEEKPTDPATPVLTDRQYADVLESLDRLLNPVAYV